MHQRVPPNFLKHQQIHSELLGHLPLRVQVRLSSRAQGTFPGATGLVVRGASPAGKAPFAVSDKCGMKAPRPESSRVPAIGAPQDGGDSGLKCMRRRNMSAYRGSDRAGFAESGMIVAGREKWKNRHFHLAAR